MNPSLLSRYIVKPSPMIIDPCSLHCKPHGQRGPKPLPHTNVHTCPHTPLPSLSLSLSPLQATWPLRCFTLRARQAVDMPTLRTCKCMPVCVGQERCGTSMMLPFPPRLAPPAQYVWALNVAALPCPATPAYPVLVNGVGGGQWGAYSSLL